VRTLGIILAGGKSSRLYPATLAVTKQLLPVYDKPLIYYPLTTLMLAGIKDYLIITNPTESQTFYTLLGTGKGLGVHIEYAVQEKPDGIANAFTIASNHYKFQLDEFDQIALILGDNIFYGASLSKSLEVAISRPHIANIFTQRVNDPNRFGVVEFNDIGNVISIEEKPENPKSNFVSTGLYFYPKNVFEYVYNLKPSLRGEYEITDLNNLYLQNRELDAIQLARGVSWFDTGTPQSLLEASNFIKAIQDHQGFLVGSPHEIAYNKRWIDKNHMINSLNSRGFTKNNPYYNYLMRMTDGY
jgi:glucose-1-phosphate thymidylyltransferase